VTCHGVPIELQRQSVAVHDRPSRCASVVTQLDTHLYRHGVANVSDAPNITDWLRGIGTVLAFAVTGARTERTELQKQGSAPSQGCAAEQL
jgi:hypothetical protein